MIRIGLTGSIGMGKSAVAGMFERLGVPVFDADAEVHRLQGPGGALVGPIEARFPGTTGPEGVDRQKLGAAVLGKPDALRALEAIVHPAVHRNRQRWLKRHRSHPLIVLDIPLLFEKARPGKAIAGIDLAVSVSAPGWVQQRRVLARPGASLEKLRRIRRLQVADHVKRARADVVIETCRARHHTLAQVRQLVSCLRGGKRR